MGGVGIDATVSGGPGVRSEVFEYDRGQKGLVGASVADDDVRKRGALRPERPGTIAGGERGILSGAADAKRSAAGLSRLVETVNTIREWRVR